MNRDLGPAPAASQSSKAMQQAVQLYQNKTGIKASMDTAHSQLMVYIDSKNTAHWAYKIDFVAADPQKNQPPAHMIYILDANNTATVYESWNNTQTIENKDWDNAVGGGFGGNERMGEVVYDGLPNDLPQLNIEYDAKSKLCYLQNADVVVKKCTNFTDSRGCIETADFSAVCSADAKHNNELWDGDEDAINGGYSPSNDALFAGTIIKKMYQNWYNLPVLTTSDGKPMVLNMVVHLPKFDNAYWDGSSMNFGDGDTLFYPLVSLGVGAHEISHGFTEQHSNLTYSGQSGGLNESFSDMAAQAAEYYAYGKNSWQIGPEIFKEAGKALRYMDQPSKDCDGRTPGDMCSIDDVSQYHFWLNVHYSSGIFNRVFYQLSTAPDWNTKKAFDVMVKANMDYWTSNTNFKQAACGVINAAKDYHYDIAAVENAVKAVGLNPAKC